MTTLSKFEQEFDAFDLLVKNLFNQDSFFTPIRQTRLSQPVDIWEDSKSGLHIEVAGTGLTKEDFSISIENDTLSISHNKETKEDDSNVKIIYKGISKKSFRVAYKISTKYDLGKADASMKNGLLHVSIPFADEAKPKVLEIK